MDTSAVERPGLFVMDCGLWIYDALSGFTSPRVHRTYRRRRVLSLEPNLRRERLTGGILYYDCTTDDARLTLENILDARTLGAVVVNHVRATRLLKEDGRFVGVEAEDLRPGGGAFALRGKVVVNATGPWSDEIRALYGADRILGPTKGVHIVVDAKKLPLARALLVREQRRVVFCIPWGARTVIGTTDTFYDGAPEDAHADRADVDYLLEVGNHYFPGAKLGLDDVLATWCGLRPLLRPPASAEASAVSREHHLETAPGLVTIAGGKLTTYRRMAAEVVDLAAAQLAQKVALSSTVDRRLPGGVDVEGAAGVAALAEELAAGGLPADVATHVARSYGARARSIAARVAAEPALAERLDPELPFIAAEVDEAVDVEQAVALADLLERRVPLALHGRDQGLGAADRVARRMGARLGWTDADVARELEHYRAVIDETRRFRA